MKRKLITFILVFSMLASFSLTAAAGDVSAHRTVEEILDEYHQKPSMHKTKVIPQPPQPGHGVEVTD